jgi:hypothetical protein
MPVSPDQQLLNLAVAAVDDIEQYTGHNMSPEMFLEIINTKAQYRQYFVDEISNVGGYDTPPTHGLDTCVREKVLDALALHATGHSWPTFGASQRQKSKFYTALDVFFTPTES